MSSVAPIYLPDDFNAATYFIDRHIEEGRGDKVAIECGDARVTYQRLFELVSRVGNGLRTLGVRIEERILLLLQDTPEFAASFFGAIKIGAVPVPVNTLLKPADYEYLLNDTRACVAIVSDSLFPVLQGIPRARLRFLKALVIVGTESPSWAIRFDDMVNSSAATLECERTSKDDSAFWLYSSGSTGRPKGCIHLQHDMVVSSERYAKAILRMTEDDRCFSVAKLFFAYGLGNGLYFPLAVGATSILLPDPPRAHSVFEVVERHRPTLFFSVPSNYAKLIAYPPPPIREYDFSPVRHAISAGEALPAAVFHRFKARFGVEILDAIGSTEMLHIVISNRAGAVRPGSSGKIVPGFDALVVDEDDRPVPQGEIGNLLIKADSVCAGYWNQHEKTKDTFTGHWTRTGDKYYQDDEGFFWYAGRCDDMQKVSGVWVSPTEIEGVLMEHSAVQEAVIVFCKNTDELPKTVACIVLQDGVAGTPDLARELQELAVSRLPAFKRPHNIEFLTEIPKTATGKIQRFKLRAIVKQ